MRRNSLSVFDLQLYRWLPDHSSTSSPLLGWWGHLLLSYSSSAHAPPVVSALQGYLYSLLQIQKTVLDLQFVVSSPSGCLSLLQNRTVEASIRQWIYSPDSLLHHFRDPAHLHMWHTAEGSVHDIKGPKCWSWAGWECEIKWLQKVQVHTVLFRTPN